MMRIDCQLSHLHLDIYLSKVISATIFFILPSSSLNFYCDVNHTTMISLFLNEYCENDSPPRNFIDIMLCLLRVVMCDSGGL